MPDSKQAGPRDGNRVVVLMGVANQTITIDGINYIEGVTPVPIAVDPTTHGILVESL